MKQNLQQTCAKEYLVANRKMMNYLGLSQGLITLSIVLEQLRPTKIVKYNQLIGRNGLVMNMRDPG